MKPIELLAQTKSPDGTSIQLTRRGHEFVILAAGRHLMSSRTHASEESLATFGLRRVTTSATHHPTILIGGLGMGYTLRAALDILPPNATVVVAELIPEIVDWNRTHLAHLAHNPLADSRVHIEITDVATLLSPHKKFDAILLDIDNSPAAFTDSANAAFYSAKGIAAAHAALNPGGTLAVWSAEANAAGHVSPRASRNFTARLRAANFAVTIEHARAHANNKGPRHTIYLAQKSHS